MGRGGDIYTFAHELRHVISLINEKVIQEIGVL